MPRLIGYRKFIIAAAFWASGSVLCAFGRMSGAEFATLASLVTGLYGAANVTARFTGGQK
jgi:hypothetical protein